MDRSKDRGTSFINTSKGSSSSEWSVEDVLKTTFSPKLRKKERADSMVKRQNPTKVVRQRIPTNRNTASSLPSVSPCKHKAGDDCDIEVRKDESIGDVTFPPFVRPYSPPSRKWAAQPNREYQLSEKERSLLEKFWTEYHTAPDGIIETCSYINAQDLYMVLRRHWINTTIMDYWLSVNNRRVQGVHIFPATMVTMRDRGWSNACSVAFNFRHSHLLDEFDVFLFPVWHQSHFYLLVAYPRLKR